MEIFPVETTDMPCNCLILSVMYIDDKTKIERLISAPRDCLFGLFIHFRIADIEEIKHGN